jgi:hypothetical protein
MPKFRFNLEDGKVIADRQLHDCPDMLEASCVADEIADHLAQLEPDLFGQGCAIVVRDENNSEVYRIGLDDIARRRRAMS